MINGKTIFSWNIPSILKGNPNDFAKALFDAGFEGVCLKGANGNAIFKQSVFGPWPLWGENIKLEMINALRSYDLKIYIWHFLYGVDPNGELAVANNICKRFNPDGYIWDAEGAFDSKPSGEANARLLSKGLKNSFPNISQGLCWWPFPKSPTTMTQWHPIPVAKAFMETVDVLMPMMYWEGVTVENALSYLSKSLQVWGTIIDPGFPMHPIGRAYTGDGGYSNPDAMIEFAMKIINLKKIRNMVGTSWWSLDYSFIKPELWKALKDIPKFNSEFIFNLNKLSTEEILTRLVYKNKDLFPELFELNN